MNNFNGQTHSAPSIHPSNFGPIDMALRSADRILGLNLTLHDLSGIFNSRSGGPLLDPTRQSHRRFTVCRIGHCAACLRHCGSHIRQRCQRERQPFVSHCWKGVTEIIVPLVAGDSLLAVLFAGAWRDHPSAPTASLPARWRAAYNRLPVFNTLHAHDLGHVLHAFGMGLIQQIEHRVLSDLPDSRQVQIMRFLHYHLHQPVRLSDLATTMHLSPSRTSHLVKELFGDSFQSLIIRLRMQRAMHFLRSTDLPVSAIGRRVGIDDEYYFNRLFKRAYGHPPARYRKHFKTNSLHTSEPS